METRNCLKCGKQITGRGITGKCRPCSQVGNKRGAGHVVTTWHKEILRMTKLASRNPMWKGDKVGYAALHDWIKYRLPKSKLCECCRKVPSYDLANISQKYKRDLTDWEWLCRRCHMMKDGRAAKFVKLIKERREE